MAMRGTDIASGSVVNLTTELSLVVDTRYTIACHGAMVRYTELNSGDTAPTVSTLDFLVLYPHDEMLHALPRTITPEAGKTIYAWAPFGAARVSVVEG